MSQPAASRQETYSGTKEVTEIHKFDEKKLEAYLADRIAGFQTPLEVRQFKGGQSNPTYQLVTPNRKYVLRRKPPGKLLPSALITLYSRSTAWAEGSNLPGGLRRRTYFWPGVTSW